MPDRWSRPAHRAVRENIQKELKEILSPSQAKRLGQLKVQMKLKNRGALALAEEKLAEVLDISEEKRKEIRKSHRDAMQELHREMERLRERYRRQLIKDMLSKEQLAKLEDLTGDEYDVKPFNPRRFVAPSAP